MRGVSVSSEVERGAECADGCDGVRRRMNEGNGDDADGNTRGAQTPTQSQHVQHAQSVGLCALCVGAERCVDGVMETRRKHDGSYACPALDFASNTSKTCKTGLSSE